MPVLHAEIASVEDLPGLLALEEGFAQRERWSAESWRADVAAADRLVLVVRQPQVVAALAMRINHDVADLDRVVVAPAHRRHGLAMHLTRQALRWAELHGAARVLLEVRADNRPAIALYRAAGFHPIASRANYYGAGIDAQIMEKDLGAADE